MTDPLPPHQPGCEPCRAERERIAARWSRPQVEPLAADVVATLDHGVRQVVPWLRSLGFETTDSGDGVSKNLGDLSAECGALPFPHVVIRASSQSMIAEADRLCAVLRSHSLWGGATVQATYDPADQSAVIMAYWPEETWR